MEIVAANTAGIEFHKIIDNRHPIDENTVLLLNNTRIRLAELSELLGKSVESLIALPFLELAELYSRSLEGEGNLNEGVFHIGHAFPAC